MMSLHEHTDCWPQVTANPTHILVLVPSSANTTGGGGLPLHCSCSVFLLLVYILCGGMRPQKFIITLFLSIEMYDLGLSTKKRLPAYVNYLQGNAGNMTNSVSFSSQSRNQTFVCISLKLPQSWTNKKSCDFLAIAGQLDPDAPSDG